MFDPTILTEETRIEGVKGETARSEHMKLELVYLENRRHDDKLDPLYIGAREVPTRNVLAHIDSWVDGFSWMHPRVRTLAVAIDALEPNNFAAELTSYQESNV